MGRSSPNDKLLLVQALKKQGHVVAVTRDGTNDAPALNEAHIGLAMGIQGTEVAKESSDIIILDDNFASVVKVGTTCVCKYPEIHLVSAYNYFCNHWDKCAVSSGHVPLNAVQLLWINLIQELVERQLDLIKELCL
ncbi:calcium-transporting ATPase 5, plasma membrane-type-like [Eucalyptus grandis]|uniref:calcium-transporting ATPase 5, plasma membrane-type-like n=1 Tax=Eucalyptus grandis TaxID=71139 RepID=UPI00192EBFFE|nr:calcium-transporting ATPase 5, plasma membrane-type-like [Eucalyptus grandis]